MITPNSNTTNNMNSDINGRLSQALRYLISDVLQQSDVASITSREPSAHALQFLMREAATKNDVAGIQSLYDAHGHILYETDRSHPCEIKPLGTPSLGPSQCALFSAAFQDDIGLTTQLEKPSDAMVAKFNDLFAHIKPTLQKHLPLWWAELESLVKTIILATAKENKFGGASAFSAWGSILINPASCVSALSTALTIVHESSHLKLFYAYLDDEIVLNNPSERYASPLRREARPMNGIYHAAFVLARMVAFLEDLKGVDKTIRIFDGTSAQDIEDEQHRSIKAFDAAYSIIASEGILTPLGQEIITESADVVARCSKN